MIEVEGSALYINFRRKEVSEIAAKGGGQLSSLPHPTHGRNPTFKIHPQTD